LTHNVARETYLAFLSGRQVTHTANLQNVGFPLHVITDGTQCIREAYAVEVFVLQLPQFFVVTTKCFSEETRGGDSDTGFLINRHRRRMCKCRPGLCQWPQAITKTGFLWQFRFLLITVVNHERL